MGTLCRCQWAPKGKTLEAGQVPAPFIDLDSDGLIDTDAFNRPIDANGNLIDERPNGEGAGMTNKAEPLGPLVNFSTTTTMFDAPASAIFPFYSMRHWIENYIITSVSLFTAHSRRLRCAAMEHRPVEKFSDDENTLAECIST